MAVHNVIVHSNVCCKSSCSSNSELLKRRLNAKEEESKQKIVITISAVMFVPAFAAAGLNFRFGWFHLSQTVIIIASIVFFFKLCHVRRSAEGKYLPFTRSWSERKPKVVENGLYGIVRHPMYTSTIFMFLSMPLVLDSVFSFAIMLIYPAIIIFRIENEERVLEKELEGYREYKSKVKYRIFPLIW